MGYWEECIGVAIWERIWFISSNPDITANIALITLINPYDKPWYLSRERLYCDNRSNVCYVDLRIECECECMCVGTHVTLYTTHFSLSIWLIDSTIVVTGFTGTPSIILLCIWSNHYHSVWSNDTIMTMITDSYIYIIWLMS